MNTAVTGADILLYLQITIAVMLCIVLYHVLFIAVDLRKTLRRIEIITREVETVILKPIHVMDSILEGITSFLEQKGESKKSSKKSK